MQDLEKMVQQARKESVKADDLVRSLTPRPNWHKLDAFAPPPSDPMPSNPTPQAPSQTKSHASRQATAAPSSQASGAQQQHGGLLSASTRELVDRLAAERKQALLRVAELEPLQGQLQQAHRLLEPEAAPISVQLQLVEPQAQAQAQTPAVDPDVPVTPLGTTTPGPASNMAMPPARSGSIAAGGKAVSMSASARGGTSIDLPSSAAGSVPPDAAAAAQAVVSLGWSNSIPRYLRWDAPVALQPYTQESLHSTLQDIWAGKAAYDGQRQAHSPLLGFLWTYFRAEQGEQQGRVAQAGYSFLYALQQQQHQLAMAAIFLRVIEGRWQEAHWHDCRHMLDAVAAVLEALSKWVDPRALSNACIARKPVQILVRKEQTVPPLAHVCCPLSQ